MIEKATVYLTTHSLAGVTTLAQQTAHFEGKDIFHSVNDGVLELYNRRDFKECTMAIFAAGQWSHVEFKTTENPNADAL